MGSITEVWKNSLEWQKYFDFLDNFTPEGTDSTGEPMKLSRYAKFLQLYVQLHYKELELRKSQMKNESELKQMIFAIKNSSFMQLLLPGRQIKLLIKTALWVAKIIMNMLLQIEIN